MKKHLQAKVKHHHVWDSYIRRWSDNKRDVWHTTNAGNVAHGSAKGLAREDNFYQIQPLMKAHVDAIKGMSELSPKPLQKQHMSYLKDFLKRQHIENLYIESGIKDEEAEQLLHATKCNMLEDLHSAHENEVNPIIAKLADRDLSVLDDFKNQCLFVQFFGHQISRTKTFKDSIIAGFARADSKTETQLAKTMEECWWFLSYMLGMSMGADIFSTRKEDRHCLLINDTDTPFITSDQPVVNVHRALTDEVKPPEDHQCDFYYPISPTVAFMVNKSDRFPSGKVQVSVDIVYEMNIKIAKKANVHLFSISKESLKPYKKHIKTNLNAIKNHVE